MLEAIKKRSLKLASIAVETRKATSKDQDGAAGVVGLHPMCSSNSSLLNDPEISVANSVGG